MTLYAGCPNYIHLMTERAKTSGVKYVPPVAPQTFVDYLQATDAGQVPYTSSDKALNPYIGKKILVLSGKEDPIVPWVSSDEVVKNLNVGDTGVKKVIVYPGVAHECTQEMVTEMADFVWEHALRGSS
jgi:alpha-beta hydrolase superfamily lysophospholipase